MNVMPCPNTWLVEMVVNAEALEEAAFGAAALSGPGSTKPRTLVSDAEYEVHVRQASPGRFFETDF